MLGYQNRIVTMVWSLTILAILTGVMGLPQDALGADKINYRLKWLFNTSVAGDLYADMHGHFKGAGLDVTVKSGGPERDAIKELELGYAQFGVASADQVIRAASKGAKVVVIAQLFQVNPLQWIYRSDSLKVEKITDLKGKIVGITYGGNDETIMRTLLAKGNIAENEVTLFSVRYDYTPFFQNKVDVWPVYRNSQGIFISQKLQDEGESVGFFNPAEHGVKFVANSVVTSEKILKENPDLVKRFITALLAAWNEAFDPANAAKTIATVNKYDKDSSEELLAEQLKITRSLVQPDPAVGIGKIDVQGWQQTEEIMLQQKVIPKAVNVVERLHPF
jgi:NitT/TauT family transport system substrate-binding protein